MREIVLDTETTGFDTGSDRIVEIGCVEVENYIATGETYHVYINPCRDVPEEAARVHGLTTEFLSDKPIFAEIIDSFRTFIGEDPLVIHNATFDMGFINAEFARHGFPALPSSQAIDTLTMARKKYPGSPASLDALCKRFQIDSSARTLHGALLDAQLLAEVYLELRGGREPGLGIVATHEEGSLEKQIERTFRVPRVFNLDETERKAHEAFLEKIKNPIWKKSAQD